MKLYLRGVRTALFGAGLPYGYTITIFSSGQALAFLHATPNVAQIYLFAAGAAAAYGALRVASIAAEGTAGKRLAESPHPIRAGAIHVLAIGLAIGAVALVGQMGSGVVWPLGGFVATLTYLGVAATEMTLQGERDETEG